MARATRPLISYINGVGGTNYRHDRHERLLKNDDSLFRFYDTLCDIDEHNGRAPGDPGKDPAEKAARLRVEIACYLQLLYRQTLAREGRDAALPVALAFRDLVNGEPAAAVRYVLELAGAAA